MSKNWLNQLRKKPSKREKILFFIMLGVVGLIGFKLVIWSNFEAIQMTKAQVKMAVPQSSVKFQKELSIPKKWMGTGEDVQDALEATLHPSYTRELTITKSEFSSTKMEEDKQKREVSLIVSGGYEALEHYLHYLENMPAPMVIQTFSIQRSAADSYELTLEISGAIYGSN
jgi:hypothetical protein